MNLPKPLIAVAITVVAAVGFAVLGGINANEENEQVIRDGLAKELDSCKRGSLGGFDGLGTSDFSSSWASSIGGSDRLTRAALEGFDYSIDDVEVHGDKATATLTLTHKSLGGMEEAVERIVADAEADSQYVSYPSSYEKQQYLMARLEEHIAGIEPTTGEPFTVDCVLKDKTWQWTKGSKELFSSKLFA